MSNKKLLIVGGTGVISFAVVNEALKQGLKVTCINRGKSKTQKLSECVEIIKADYRNESLIKSKIIGRQWDTVIDVLCYNEKDIEYSVSLFKEKCKQFIFFSSCAVYNKGKGDYECVEDSELVNSIWNYSINKVLCERRLINLSKEYNFNYTIVRPAVTYGNTRIPYGIMPPYGYHGTLIQRIIHNKPIILWDGGEAYSTITRVEDFAVGLVGLIGNEIAYNQVYNIVGDERYKWKEVIDTIGEIIGYSPIYCSMPKEFYANEIPERKGELLGGRGISQLLNNRKIKSVVPDFYTRISLKEGLEMTLNYYRDNNYLKGIDYRFDADTDRIIKKFCKSNNIPQNKYKLGFVDYLNIATIKDRADYFLEFHKENILIKFVLKLKSLLKDVCKYLKFIFNVR